MSEETSASLDTILNETTNVVDLNPAEPETTGSTEQPEAKADAEAQPKPETGDKDSQDGTPPPEGSDNDKKADNDPQEAFKKAAIDERRKRQATEQRIAALEEQLRLATQGQQKAPDIFEDPEGFTNYQDQKRQQELTNLKLVMSESMFRDSLEQQGKSPEEFEEVAEYFRAETQRNPALVQEMLAHPNPAKFVYQTGQRFKTLNEIGDPAAYRAKIERETEAKLLPKIDELVNARVSALMSERLPRSLAGVQSAGDRNQSPVDEGHVPLSAILGEK